MQEEQENIGIFDNVSFQQQDQSLTLRKEYYGNYIILMRDSNGQPTIMLGPHWYIFITALIITSGLLIFMLTSITDQLTTFWFYVLAICSLLFAGSYLKIGLSNPGFALPLPNPTSNQMQSHRFCKKCNTMTSRDIYHCQDCDVCIDGYDHHCPWIGKCVGSNNLNLFYFFLIMTFGTLIICFIGTVASAASMPHHNSSNMRNGLPRIQG